MVMLAGCLTKVFGQLAGPSNAFRGNQHAHGGFGNKREAKPG